MLDIKQINVGDIVKMKKPIPVGQQSGEVTRTGMDFGIKCCGCGRFTMLSRVKFEKRRKS